MNTEYGLLVTFGEFQQQRELVKQLPAVPIQQNTPIFSSQNKTIEFLAGILGGINSTEKTYLSFHTKMKVRCPRTY